MPASFPGSLFSAAAVTDNVDYVLAAQVNALTAEMAAVEAELGVNPRGAAASVGAFLASLSAGKSDSTHTHAHSAITALGADDHGQYMMTDGTRHDLTGRHTFGGALGTPGTPTNSAVGDVAAAGNGTVAARWNHVHGRESVGGPATTVSSMTTFGLSPSVGTGTHFSLEDHNHGTPGTSITGPSGVVAMWPGSAPPTGWLMCDGSAVSRTTYAAIFGITGTKYGAGNGSTTFNLPNFNAGTVPVGDPLTGTVPSGAAGSHSHSGSSAATSHAHGGSSGAGSSHTHSITAPGSTGAGSSHGHSGSTGNESAEHQHGITVQNGISHYFSDFSDGTQPHGHSVSIGAESGHTHGIDSMSANAEAAHNHGVTVNAENAHIHGVTVNANTVFSVLGIAFIIKI